MNSAVILAAGSGKRTGLSYNKVFLDIKGKPLIYYTITAFEKNNEIDEIILVLKKDEKGIFEKELAKYQFKKIRAIAEGGNERQDSVRNGLNLVNENCEVVLIHDGARCFVTSEIISEGIKNAKIFKAASPGVVPKDTVKIVDEKGMVIAGTVRDSLRYVQTPQCFDFKLIKEAYNSTKSEKIYTDDNEVFSNYCKNIGKDCKIHIYEGDYNNFKITSSEDILLTKTKF